MFRELAALAPLAFREAGEIKPDRVVVSGADLSELDVYLRVEDYPSVEYMFDFHALVMGCGDFHRMLSDA